MRLCYPLKKLAQASQMSRKIAVVVFLKTNRCRQERLEFSEKNHGESSLCVFFFVEDQGTQERQGKEVELSMDLLRKFPNYQDKNLTKKCCKAFRCSGRK